ncbi:MAG: DUF3307 domain-containing protein [Candidatus Firestonebacteria bacterium]|nr:DUF3307 domain-containing protein [Candidatus Firestonebacteria bacterium]
MFIFIRLLAAHFLADFMLQTDSVFKIKVKYKWGVLLHGAIVALITALFLLPYFSSPVVIGLYILGSLVHIFQDRAKIAYNLQIENNNLWTFLLDQIGHIAVLAIISYGAVNLQRLPYPGPEFFEELYSDDRVMLFISWLVVITYSTAIMQEYLKKIITGKNKEKIVWPAPLQKHVEMAQRALLAVFIFQGELWYAGAFGVALAGYLLVKAGKYPVLNYQLGTVLAVIIGFLMKFTI